ncbi:MAG TPA: undecaprenyldiphospho-muramoylpentapeptide beta-N-acetylglucosaminyltransferase, partial [Chloroflexi bacterium]|nr:undecaprenyldiphospho-muramoylpentapeptide beta-N-acetylglucosaminyltransferase [Chloroflexota bacterium]
MRLLFCGGGTGGHVYPALAVVEALRGRGEGAAGSASSPDFLYVGSVGGREVELVRRAGLPLVTVHGGGLHGVGWRRLPGNVVRLLRGFAQAWRIIGRFRPAALFVTGGYVSVPVALAARLRRVPILVYL